MLWSPAKWRATAWLFLCLCLLPSAVRSQTAAWRDDRILIQPKAGASLEALRAFHSARRGEVLKSFAGLGQMQVVTVPRGETVAATIAQYQQSGLVEFAEPDYLIHADLTPNDPRFTDGTLWGLNNTGQNGGIPDADIDAPEGWDVLTSASNIVVAVLDTGVRATHEDLAANMWANPLDGSHGYNAFTDTNNPSDDNGHGTLVSGVLGATGNNGKGVVGVAWKVQIMACKCLDSDGTGSDSELIACIDYARTNGARIMNASLDTTGTSLAVSNAIYWTRQAGILFVASAGNTAADVDVNPHYPACYPFDNIVSVAATTRSDALWNSSNFGATNVDLAAPGDQIYSTFFISDTFYLGPLSGTSMSAPYVTGTLALMLAKFPAEDYHQIINRLLNATDPIPALAGKCVTGGRLNLRKALSPPILLTPLGTSAAGALQLRVAAGPNRICVIQATTNLTTSAWSPIYTNTTSAAGSFDFTDLDSAGTPHRFYRAISNL